MNVPNLVSIFFYLLISSLGHEQTSKKFEATWAKCEGATAAPPHKAAIAETAEAAVSPAVR